MRIIVIEVVAFVCALAVSGPAQVLPAVGADNPLKLPTLSGVVEIAKTSPPLEPPLGAGAAPKVSGNNVQVNQDRSNLPQNETAIAVNPLNPQNIVAGANDYRVGFGLTGFYASMDGGKTWVDGILPNVSWPDGDTPDGGGDPVVAYDSRGIVYMTGLAFERTNNRSSIVLNRSENGGQTWTRPSYATGDGIVVTNITFSGSRVLAVGTEFADKEWMAIGPRPQGVAPLCRAEASGGRPATCSFVGPDRIYVTWTRFQIVAAGGTSAGTSDGIMEVHSDDGGRTWSAPREISGFSPLCDINGNGIPGPCSFNQPSVVTVGPDGDVYVVYRNTNTPAENQLLAVKSEDGGNTWSDPVRVAWVFDINYPTAGGSGDRWNCLDRGQQSGRRILTNSCFRVLNYPAAAANPNNPDEVYVTWFDNRYGDATNTDSDIFFCRSRNGGRTWGGCAQGDPNNASKAGPIRVNRDARGNNKDQYFPWMVVSPNGAIDVMYYDRRLDTTSRKTDFGQTIKPAGNYLTHVFVNRSADGGITWREFRASNAFSNMDYAFRGGIFIGDYNALAANNRYAYPFWTDARNGSALVRQSDVFIALMPK